MCFGIFNFNLKKKKEKSNRRRAHFSSTLLPHSKVSGSLHKWQISVISCVCKRAVIIQTKFNSKFIHSFSIELCSLVTVVDFERLVVSNHPHVHRGINVYIMELAKSLANWVATESWKYKYINDDGPAHIARCTCFIIYVCFFTSLSIITFFFYRRIWMSYDKKSICNWLSANTKSVAVVSMSEWEGSLRFCQICTPIVWMNCVIWSARRVFFHGLSHSLSSQLPLYER